MGSHATPPAGGSYFHICVINQLIVIMAVKLDAFCPDGDSWTSYEERAQEFFLANDVNVERKMIAIFLSSLSPDMYEKVKALCAPAKPSELKWDEIS